MKKTSVVVTSFVFVYLMFVVALLPARFVMQWVNLPHNVKLGQIEGTIWHSQLDAIKVDNWLVEKLEAKLSVLSLLTLDPQIDVTFGDALLAGPEGRASMSGFLSELKLTDVQVNLAANQIASQLPLPVPVTAHSTLDIVVEEFVAGKEVCQQLDGDIRWSKAAVTALEQKVSLGALHAKLACKQGNVELTLDEANDLGMSFTAFIGGGGRMSGDGYLTPKAQMPAEIRQLIPFLGKADNQGRYRLRF
ncbi:type II secretion protein N [Thalassotalea insulae]|uniref:Type II secretion system protein N n=1 Tax=Thalassotalea insulae TaxID=2056778 RepID=A0ABQ6GXK0_9GAMM|nr:type II secretion system protein N [Thalassotalea insulae]GLX78921.1 type II secretion protein N [Thalassotalea insulae]